MKSTKTQFYFWQKWLTWVNGLGVIMGALIAFAGDSFVFELHNKLTQINVIKTEFEPAILILKKWLFGVLGGTLMGFHVLVIYISENAFKKKEKWAFNAICFGIMSWFLIDTGISLYYNAWHNVVMVNLVAMVSTILPLILTRNEFKN